MRRLSFYILSVLVLSSCFSVSQLENRLKLFCGFDSVESNYTEAALEGPPIPKNCRERIAFCPVSIHENQIQFCEVPYSRAVSVNGACAPESIPICSENICQNRPGKIKHLPNFISEGCIAASLQKLAIKSVSSIEKDLGVRNVVVGVLGVGDVLYYHYIKDGEQWVVFSGSIHTCNWLAGFDASLVESKRLHGMNIHKGYLTIVESAWLKIRPLIEEHRGLPLRVVGHSMGGALAVLFAMFGANDAHEISRVLTFGQPMVTDLNGVKLFEELYEDDISLIRFVNAADAVPYAMQYINRNYVHFGPEVLVHPSSGTQFSYLKKGEGYAYGSYFSLIAVEDHIDYIDPMTKVFGCKSIL